MSMVEASLPLQGPEKGLCECESGCGLFGRLGRPDKRGRRHVKGCADHGCRVCLGRRSKDRGGRRQSMAARALGIPRTSGMHPGHEETMAGAVRIECKSGAQVGPIWTRYLAAEVQSEAQRPIGDHRPFAMVAMPKGTKDGLVVVRLSKVNEWAAAIVEQWSEL
jgi:hypothetical protein